MDVHFVHVDVHRHGNGRLVDPEISSSLSQVVHGDVKPNGYDCWVRGRGWGWVPSDVKR